MGCAAYSLRRRDINSVKNMKKIVAYWLVHKKRPEKYRRSYVLKQILTPTNFYKVGVK